MAAPRKELNFDPDHPTSEENARRIFLSHGLRYAIDQAGLLHVRYIGPVPPEVYVEIRGDVAMACSDGIWVDHFDNGVPDEYAKRKIIWVICDRHFWRYRQDQYGGLTELPDDVVHPKPGAKRKKTKKDLRPVSYNDLVEHRLEAEEEAEIKDAD
jgi:hypothetical protein